MKKIFPAKATFQKKIIGRKSELKKKIPEKNFSQENI